MPRKRNKKCGGKTQRKKTADFFRPFFGFACVRVKTNKKSGKYAFKNSAAVKGVSGQQIEQSDGKRSIARGICKRIHGRGLTTKAQQKIPLLADCRADRKKRQKFRLLKKYHVNLRQGLRRTASKPQHLGDNRVLQRRMRARIRAERQRAQRGGIKRARPCKRTKFRRQETRGGGETRASVRACACVFLRLRAFYSSVASTQARQFSSVSSKQFKSVPLAYMVICTSASPAV